MKTSSRKITRRDFVARSSATLVATSAGFGAASAPAAVGDAGARQAMGTKAGEVTDTSAIIWARLTESATRNTDGVAVAGKVDKKKKRAEVVTVPVAQLEGACPGAAGRVRLRHGMREDLSDAVTTDWADVSAETDFAHQFAISGLKSATVYHYVTETAAPGDAPAHAASRGKFETAPVAAAPADLRFCVMTCQAYHDRDHADGHNIYPSMLALDPKFVVFTGDNVYYDSEEPKAITPELARYHWQRMFSLPRIAELTRNVSTYWEKDDHDTLSDDCWPGKTMWQLRFEEGQKIFRQQVPLGEKSYRTFRWGRDLQIWLTDGRDFRSANNIPDGPEKTIWGAEQKEWFKRTVMASDATWKVLLSPTPLVGPDRKTKNDNHSNEGFRHEGDEIRSWLKANAPDNFFIITGDRHWQYHSVHPESGVTEFACGPASDKHASGSPGEDKTYHKFHRVKGGFITVMLKRDGGKSGITFEHRDVMGKVVYEWGKTRMVV